MNRRLSHCWSRVAIALLAVGAVGVVAAVPTPAGADTDPTTLAGEGGTFLQPVVTKLIKNSTPNFNGLFGGFVATGLDAGITDFVGSAPNAFNADFTVSERPLTATEAGTAKANGRSFAYVPFAATPVAIGTLVTSATFSSNTINSSDLCPHINLSVVNVGEIFGFNKAQPVNGWDDPRFTCSNGKALHGGSLLQGANADPTMANFAVMALMDSDPTAKGYFQANLGQDVPLGQATTTDTTPSEHWPYTGTYLIAGGDQPFINKLLLINATTNVPSNQAGDWVLGAAFPISSIWTGSPVGSPWNIPTAAVQNAANSDVAPSTVSAAAAEGDAALAKTSDPTTNNLVTFNASTTDAAAYNNFLMEESYLVVPTNGLPANKATALAGFIRYVLGPNGQRDVRSLGAAGATPAMVTAGLTVASALDAEAAKSAASTSPTSPSTSPTTAAGTATSPASASNSGTSTDSGSTVGGGGNSGGPAGSSGSGLAFTGPPNLGAVVGVGALLILLGTVVRRRLRRRLEES
jgi:ABC-type phosphate transport system substrate-binding protein